MGSRAGLDGGGKSRPPPGFLSYSFVLCASSVLVSLSLLCCILPFCHLLTTHNKVQGSINCMKSSFVTELFSKCTLSYFVLILSLTLD